MRTTLKIGCLVLGLLVARGQPAATATGRERANRQSNAAVANRAADRAITSHAGAMMANGAAANRSAGTAATSRPDSSAVAGPAGQANHVERQAVEARRAPRVITAQGWSHTAPAATASNRAAPQQGLPSLKESMPAPSEREKGSPSGNRSDMANRTTDQARQPGPRSAPRMSVDATAAAAAGVNRLDRAAVEARRRTPQAGSSGHSVPAGAQLNPRLPTGPTN